MNKQKLEQELKKFETEVQKMYPGITKMCVTYTYPSLGIPVYDVTMIYPDMKNGEHYNTLKNICVMLADTASQEVCNHIFGICIKQEEEMICYCLENGEIVSDS